MGVITSIRPPFPATTATEADLYEQLARSHRQQQALRELSAAQADLLREWRRLLAGKRPDPGRVGDLAERTEKALA